MSLSLRDLQPARGLCRVGAALSLCAALPVLAAPIYTCTDSHNHTLTSDRPIVECLDRDQRVLNSDGSMRRILPKSMTADERAAAEQEEHRKQAEEEAKLDATRRDRNLLARFPDEDSHNDARNEAMDTAYKAIAASQRRLADLKRDRKPMLQEAEFYQGKPLPLKLKSAIDGNQVAIDAQQTLIQNQQVELGRLTKMYDSELAHLRKLWAGAPPGFEWALSLQAASAASSAAAPAAASGATRSVKAKGR